MQIASQQLLEINQPQAWAALNDTEILKACIAGCESLTLSGDDEYDVLIQVAVGPVKARFKGKLRLSELNPPTSYRIDFEGQGGTAGHGKGTAEVRLEPQGDSCTRLHYDVTASVGGKIAQIGQRLVDMAAQKMAADFFARFDVEMKRRHPRPPDAASPSVDAEAAEPAPRSGLGRLIDRVPGVFGRSSAAPKPREG